MLKLYGSELRFDIFQGIISNEKDGVDAITLTTQSFWIQDKSGEVHVNWTGGTLPFKSDHKIKAIRAVNTKTGKMAWVAVKNLSSDSGDKYVPCNRVMISLDLSTYGSKVLVAFALIGMFTGAFLARNEPAFSIFFAGLVGMGLGSVLGFIPTVITNIVQNILSFKKYENKLSELMKLDSAMKFE